MTDEKLKLVIGGLLHDIGKVIYRQGGEKQKHSLSGHMFLKEEAKISDREVLACVLYHHADLLRNAKVEMDALAYIVYMADNIAASTDRRKKEAEDIGFEMAMPLQSVFNILNGNHQEMYYAPKTLNTEDGINYPVAKKIPFDESFYKKIKANLLDNLLGMEWSPEYINSLLEIIEGNLSYIPSSTAKGELADISLYDHMKLTAAVSTCIYDYLKENSITDYKQELFNNGAAFYNKKAFLLYSMDVSGIQDFIYTIVSKNALKTLRARSFYLEIMMEHIIDNLLQELQLSRTNLIYSGGGHCYILLANTDKTKSSIKEYNNKLNNWLKDVFKISLYVADGYAECSSNDLKNVPHGSYADLFKQISNRIAKKKSRRYTAQDIFTLNNEKYDDYTRECKVCRRIGKVDKDDTCPICKSIETFSKNILQDDFFTISLEKKEGFLPLPGGYYLSSDSRESLVKKMQSDYFVRAYSKNKMFTGRHIATKLWVGSYSSGKTFEEMAQEIQCIGEDGIARIGVLRADVDNLGQAFVSGFDNVENNNRYVTLSRTATLSRQLSLFFKLHINKILQKPEYGINKKLPKSRNATICYSGGDDLFIVGSWNEVIELAVDIRRDFEKYTQGTLSLSAGIGIYTSGYPISVIAKEVATMEDESKRLQDKNAVTLLEDGKYHTIDSQMVSDGTYKWIEFENEVISEKYAALYKFFSQSDERGMNFLYNLLDIIRNRGDKINFARWVYILSRLEPDKDASQEQKENYREFSGKMYEWIKREKDCRQLKTAMTLYAYMKRKKEV